MRYWNNKVEDEGSKHSIGNGNLAVYGQGPDIIQLFGPPYSSPSLLSMHLKDEAEVIASSQRETGSAIWKHSLKADGEAAGEILDFVYSGLPCFVRKLSLIKPFKFIVKLHKDAVPVENTKRFEESREGVQGSFLTVIESGTYFYNKYPLPKRLYHQVICSGAMKIVPATKSSAANESVFEIHCDTGESTLYVVGGPDYPDCVQNAEKVLSASADAMLQETCEYWCGFANRRHNFEELIPDSNGEGVVDKEHLLSVIDSVSVLIKTQQAVEGGVLAGHNYHMGYVRDQYGVSRCLLKLGYYSEAKAILEFYWNIWKKYGKVHNAQPMGIDSSFHVHENDEVEITGYLIIQAFDYYNKTKDHKFLKEILPMLEWALVAQTKHLKNYMLPFNGDETYVAGQVLPRYALNHGSAEATLLFITGGERLISWIDKNGLRDSGFIEKYRKILKETRDHYRENFWKDGKILTNNPSRISVEDFPRFRHGVCEGCFSRRRGHFWFGWTELSKNKRYLCPECIEMEDIEAAPFDKEFYLQSVSLMPLYIDSDMFSKDEIREIADDIIRHYRETSRLPSSPEASRTVGYDYGLLLYTLASLKHPAASEIYQKMMEVLDPTGAWVEYYTDGKPDRTRCRPWESGINLEAAVHYAMS